MDRADSNDLESVANVDMTATVHCRISLEPSQSCHMGDCKTALLNFMHVKQHEGQLTVRFEDKNQCKENTQWEQSMLEDLQKMGIVPDHVSRTSDYMDILMIKCETMIKQGLAYCDPTPVKQMRTQRLERVESMYRNASIEDNLKMWTEMKMGSTLGKQYMVRAKIDMKASNATMRDPGMYKTMDMRVSDSMEPVYHVYPLYMFSCPVVDALQGITHVLRSSEFHDYNETYTWFLHALNLKPITLMEFTRFQLTYKHSCRQWLQYADEDRVMRQECEIPTFKGLLGRGLQLDVLKDFLLSQSKVKTIHMTDLSALWRMNRKKLNAAMTPTYNAIEKSDAVVMRFTPIAALIQPIHNVESRKSMLVDYQEIFIQGVDAKKLVEGETITLIHWANTTIDTIHKDSMGNITSLEGTLNTMDNIKKTPHQFIWLPTLNTHLTHLILLEDVMGSQQPAFPTQTIDNVLSTAMFNTTHVYGDVALNTLQKGDIIRLAHRGYFICETPFSDTQAIHLLAIAVR